MNSINKIIDILQYKKQSHLAKLLIGSEYELRESSSYGSKYNSFLATVEIYSPIEYYEKLKSLSDLDKQAIIEAFHIPYPIKAEGLEINDIEFFVHPFRPFLEKEKQLLQPSNNDPKFWKSEYFRIFISHSSKIKVEAHLLSKTFDNYGITSFVAHDDIEPTKEWLKEIEDALATCNAIVALLNEDFRLSKWCDQEIGISYGLGKIIIPIRLGLDPYGFMGKFQGLQGINRQMPELADEVFKLLVRNDKSNEQISRSMVKKFKNSSSFSESKNSITHLESLTFMDNSLLEELQKSKENSQISYSFGVPEKLDKLIAAWSKKLNK